MSQINWRAGHKLQHGYGFRDLCRALRQLIQARHNVDQPNIIQKIGCVTEIQTQTTLTINGNALWLDTNDPGCDALLVCRHILLVI